ncbi:hypothetical protein IIO_06598 [Bacillus cereus VD115]|nr:hypothetical protein IIO_06598 [Bacillus cereus VD115]
MGVSTAIWAVRNWKPILISGLVGTAMVFTLLSGGEVKKETNTGGEGALFCKAKGQEIGVNELNISLQSEGAFSGKGQAFLDAGKKYGVDPVLAGAIAIHETGHGTSNAVRNKNNPGGLMDPSTGWATLQVFPTLDAGIDAMIRNLFRNYISKGLTTPELIGPKYAPIGAANDPGSLNRFWIPTVTKNIQKLGGMSYECSQQGGGGSTGGGTVSASGYVNPIAGNPKITSNFGHRILGGVSEFHKGLDLGCQDGVTPILASKDGKVAKAFFGVSGSGFGGYGNVVVIDHGGGTWTLYGHMSKLAVTEGQTIGKGQPVGTCGKTGQVTGPHLHFEVKNQLVGGQQDPLPLIPLGGAK